MPAKAKQGKRSPIREADKPLRNPGESTQLTMDEILTDKLVPVLIAAFLSMGFAVYEWLRFLFQVPPQPLGVTVVALGVSGYAAYKYFTLRNQYKNLKLGLEGEKRVGQFLEDMRRQGCEIFHDIPGDGFNIDHVVVSPHGVFVIETKTYSKPIRGESSVEFDGERVLVNGFQPERDPVRQVRALRSWLYDYLAKTTGKQCPVKGVLLFPGWWVEPMKGKPDIWALNEKALPLFIENEPISIPVEDLRLASFRITNYVQNFDREPFQHGH